jgi:glycosyltransferase involved in cell wall biosynthesis
MKLLQVCPRYYPNIGGVEEHVRNISERLVKDYDVTVATTDPSGKLLKEEVINGVKIKRFTSWAPKESYFFSRDLNTFLKANSQSFDIVHAHSYHAFPALYAAQTKGKNKLFFTAHYHGTGHSFLRKFLHVPYKHFGKKIFDAADQLICVSNYERDLLLRNFKINPVKTHVIPNGVTISDFQGIVKRKRTHRTILFVGRLEKYKGAQNIIQALPKIDEDIFLVVIGKGPFEKDLVKLCSRLHLDNRVVFLKDLTRNELVQEYVDADLFVLLSEHEAYGICIAESLAARTPCLVANASGLSEWIDNKNVFGIGFPIVNSELISCMKEVIGKTVDKPKLQDWDTVTQEIVTLYKSV